MEKLLRHKNLVERGIVSNRTQQGRLINHRGFPAGFLLGPNTRVFPESEVQAWLDAQAEAAAEVTTTPDKVENPHEADAGQRHADPVARPAASDSDPPRSEAA